MTTSRRLAQPTRASRMSRRTRVLGASAIALTGLMSSYLQVLRSPSAYATANCTVTTGTDNVGSPPAGSLRACVSTVDAGGGGTITFDVSTVTLVGELPVLTNSLHLDGGDAGVTITGGGGPGAGDFRMLDAPFSYPSTSTVELTNLTLEDFYFTGGSGSVISVEDAASVTITGVTAQNNETDHYGTFFIDIDGAVTVKDSKFLDNKAEYGGALYLGGDQSLDVDGSTFAGNYSTDDGGAIWQDGGSVTFTDSTFTDNESLAYGGALYFFDGDFTHVTSSTFKGNKAQYGGAIYIECCSTMTVDDSLFDGNYASSSGAVIYQPDSLDVTNSTFINNSAAAGTSTLEDTGITTITNSFFGSNSGDHVLNTGGDLTLNFVTIAENTTTQQAVVANAAFTVTGSVIADAVAACDPTGATITDTYAVASDATCTFSGTGSVENAGAGDLDFLSPETVEVDGVDQTVLPMEATSVLATGAPSSDLGTGLTADQVGNPRSLTWTIGSRQYVLGPDAPTALTATAGDGDAEIAFTPGAPGTSPITNYEYTIDGGATFTALSPADATSPVTIPGLTNGTTYTIKIRAVTIIGKSPWSAAVTVTPVPPGTPPLAPQRPGLVAGDGQVKVSVARAAGGSRPTSFTVTAAPGGRTCTVTSSTGGTCTVTGLNNGVIYTFTATASNAYGTSGPSQASQKARPGVVPVPGPQPVSKRLRPGRSQLIEDGKPQSVTVEPGEGDKGVRIVGDSFSMDLDGLNAQGRPMNLGPDGVLVLANEREVLTNGEGFLPNTDVKLYVDPEVRSSGGRAKDRGIYIGKARTNAKGEFSGTATLPGGIANGVHDIQAVGVSKGNLLRVMTLGVLVSDLPNAVRDLAVERALAKGVVVLTWDAPRGSRLIGVDRYQVQYRYVLATAWLSAGSSDTRRATVDDLIPGCRYEVRVRARNVIGAGPWSVTSAYVPVQGRMRLPSGDLRCLDQ